MYKAFYGLDTDLTNLNKVLKKLGNQKFEKDKNVYNKVGQININLEKQMIDLIMKKYFETKKSFISNYINFIYYNVIFFLKYLIKIFFRS